MTLSVSKSGTGSGSVTSSPGGITCGADCTESVAPGAQLSLAATPAAGSAFAGWSGACTGTGPCTVTVNTATSVTAAFNLTPVTLSVSKSGTGSGSVTSSPGGITCGADCTESVAPGTQLSLTATAAAGSTFAGWSGACTGTASCTVTMSAATTVTASFNLLLPPPVQLSVTKTGTGGGRVSSTPAGIDCGSVCTGSMAAGTVVTLTAVASDGSAFTGWGNACSGTAPTCTWTLSAGAVVTATFEATRVDRRLRLAPVPVVRSLSPTRAAAGGAGLTLTVKGKGFVAGSVVRWNGVPRTTTYVTGSQLRAAITAADLVTASSVPVDVVSPAPGGGASEPLTFTITAAPDSTTASSTSLSTSSLSTSTVSLSVGGDIVIDNADPGVQDSVGGRTFTGTWCRARARTSYGRSSLFACGRGVDTYRWTPRIPASGVYEVYVWIPASRYLSTSVPFVVAHGTGTTVRTLNQRTGTGRWVLHGQYVFQAGTAGYVETSSGQAWAEGGTAAADAVRFVRR